jgi:quinol monooxygenase YgiN
MCGTIARFRIWTEKSAQFLLRLRELNTEKDPGLVDEYFYQMDADPNVYYMAVVFESREAYRANSTRSETQARALELMEFVADEPEWHDWTVVLTLEKGSWFPNHGR